MELVLGSIKHTIFVQLPYTPLLAVLRPMSVRAVIIHLLGVAMVVSLSPVRGVFLFFASMAGVTTVPPAWAFDGCVFI